MYELKFTIVALMVQLWLPVVAVVENLVTSCGIGFYGNLIGLIELEGSPTGDYMNMRRDFAGEHNRVASLDSQGGTVDSELGSRSSDHGEANKGLREAFESHSVR